MKISWKKREIKYQNAHGFISLQLVYILLNKYLL